MRILSVLWLLSLLGTLTACTEGSDDPQPDSDTVAVVDGYVIRADDVRAALRREGVGRPERPDTPETRREVLEGLIRRRALISRALEAGYDKNPEVVAQFHEFVIDRYESAEREKRLAAVTVTEDDIEKFYRENLAEFSTDAMAQGAVILVRVPADADVRIREAARGRAKAALEEARRLGPQAQAFGDVATRYSDHGSKEIGGDIGWLKKDQKLSSWEPGVINALFALEKPGDLSPIFETPRGFVIVKLLDVRDAKARSLESRSGFIRRNLTAARQAEAREKFYVEAREKSRVWIAEDLLESLTLTPAAPK
jgi:parvulin-like peptidyl-prolyl isomerase